MMTVRWFIFTILRFELVSQMFMDLDKRIVK